MSSESSSPTTSCPLCKGLGRVDAPAHAGGLLCTRCDGTGSARVADLLRAWRDGYECGMLAMRNALPVNAHVPHAELLIDRIERQRREDYAEERPAEPQEGPS